MGYIELVRPSGGAGVATMRLVATSGLTVNNDRVFTPMIVADNLSAFDLTLSGFSALDLLLDIKNTSVFVDNGGIGHDYEDTTEYRWTGIIVNNTGKTWRGLGFALGYGTGSVFSISPLEDFVDLDAGSYTPTPVHTFVGGVPTSGRMTVEANEAYIGGVSSSVYFQLPGQVDDIQFPSGATGILSFSLDLPDLFSPTTPPAARLADGYRLTFRTVPMLSSVSTTQVVECYAIGENDRIRWDSIAAPLTELPTPVVVPSEFGSRTATVTHAVGGAGVMCILLQGTGWAGSFAPGDGVLYVGSLAEVGGPGWVMKVAFNTPVFGCGFQLQTDGFGNFTGTVRFYTSANVLLHQIVRTDCPSGAGADDTAAFFGITSPSANISYVLISTFGSSDDTKGFAINEMCLQTDYVPLSAARRSQRVFGIVI